MVGGLFLYGCAHHSSYGEHSPYKFLKIAPPPNDTRNEYVTHTHGMGVLMSGKGPWNYHGPRVCVV